MAKFKNLIFVALLVLLFVEVLIVFPNKLEHEDDKDVQARVELQEKRKKELDEAGKSMGDASALSGQKMSGIHFVESQQGQRDWELFAESAEGSQGAGAGAWRLKHVRALFYNKEQVEFTVTGDEGSIDAKDLSIRGHVVTRSTNGYSFETSAIFYSSLKRQIQSPEEVLMKGPGDKSGSGLVVKGRKMLVLVDQSKMLIQEQVSATKPMTGGKKFDVIADGAEFSGQSYEAKFLGSVRMGYDNMRLEGPEASFLYKTGVGMLSSVAVKGGVKVSDADKFATSDSVDLDLLANKYVFKGRPKVIQNNDELSGEEIVFLDGGKKVKVERVRAQMENKEK